MKQKEVCDFCGGRFCKNLDVKLAIDNIHQSFFEMIFNKNHYRPLGKDCYKLIVEEGF